MKRSEMIEHIYDELLTKLEHYKLKQDSDVWAEYVANELLDMIEGFDMLPPCLSSEKCQFLMHKYIDPNFNMWDEEFEKQHKKE